MGMIKINNIIYGSNLASDIIYNNITVQEKLDTIPVFDINDNGNVPVVSDVITYGHIIDNLNSDSNSLVLSAKQGKVLSNKIDNIDLSGIDNNANDIGLLNERVDIIEEKMTDNEIITALDNRITENTNDISELNSNVGNLSNNITKYNSETDELEVYINGNLVGTIYCAFTEPRPLVPILSGYTCDIGEVIYGNYYSTSYPWYVFGTGNMWHGDAGIPNYLGFKFYEPTCLKRVKFKAYPLYGATIKIQASKSESDSSWFDLTDSIYVNPDEEKFINVDNNENYRRYRVYFLSSDYLTGGKYYALCDQMQFYGR